MASVKVVLRKKKNSSGKFPLAIRVTKNRKSSYVYTGQYVSKQEWDEVKQKVKKNHPNSTRLNNFLAKKLSEVNDKLVEAESTTDHLTTARSIAKRVKRKAKNSSFFTLAKSYLDDLERSKKFSRISAEKPRVKHLKEFLNGEDIAFHEITESLLKKFQVYLKAERNVSKRTIMNHLVVIRTVFNLAIKEGLTDSRYYPFGKGKIQIKFPQSNKMGLNREEVLAIEKLEIERGTTLWHTRNVWLFSFYFAGMRISDVLRLSWKDINDDRLHYTMGKNDKYDSLKIPMKALEILEGYRAYKEVATGLVFPELKKADLSDERDIQRKIRTAVKKFNDNLAKLAELAGIDKKITNHIARHTFGNLSGEKISIQMLQKLYRHSSITTTIGYQANFIHKDADEALEAVVSF